MEEFKIIIFIILGWLILGFVGGIVWLIGVLLIATKKERNRMSIKGYIFIIMMLTLSGGVGLYKIIEESIVAVKTKKS